MVVAEDARTAVEHAIQVAFRIHGGQECPRTGVPYICHPVAVLGYIADWGISSVELRQAALLHEALQPKSSCPTTVYELEQTFGRKVAEIVQDCTFVFAEPDEELSDKDRRMRMKWALDRHFEKYYELPVESLIVRVADRIATISDLRGQDHQQAAMQMRVSQSLFSAMLRRLSEIEAVGGEQAYGRMRYHYDTLKQMLANR